MGKEGEQPPLEPEPQEFSFANPFVWHGETHDLIISEAGDTLSLQLARGEEVVVFDIKQLTLHEMRRLSPDLGERQITQPAQEKPVTEKEPTIKLTGLYDQQIEYRQVMVPNKQQSGKKERQWLYKFSMTVPGDTADTNRSQVVTSLGKAAERHKKLELQHNEEIEATGKMQHRTNTRSQETTDELFAFGVRRKKPKMEAAETR